MKREYLASQNWAVQRPHVTELLRAGLDYPLVVMGAGPGYGKTTAATAFCRDVGHRLVWLRLTPQDSEPHRFWQRLVRAAGHEMAPLAAELDRLGFPRTNQARDALLRLAVQYSQKGGRVLLALDSAEHLSRPVLRLLRAVLELEMESLCVLLISNDWQPLQCLTDTGRHFEIGAKELQFTEQETALLLARCGREESAGEAQRLTRETDGWPLVLHLVAARPGPLPIHTFGEQPHLQVVAELFESHYFANYDRELQCLLIQLSFFEQLPLELLRAIGAPDVDWAVEQLGRNVFICYDYAAQQFTFQKLYRAFLAQKQPTLSGEVTQRVLEGAGRWLRETGRYAEALERFLQARSYDELLLTLNAIPLKTCGADTANQLLLLLEQLPPSYEHRPDMALARGLLYLKAQRMQAAKTMFLRIEQQLAGGVLDERQRMLLGEAYAGLYVVTLAQGGTEALAYARKAAAILPPGARCRCMELAEIGNAPVFFLPGDEPGLLGRMLRFPGELVASLDPLVLEPEGWLAYVQLFCAEGHFFAGELDAALDSGLRAEATARAANWHAATANTLYLLMRVALFQGNGPRAQALLLELETTVEKNAPFELANLLDCARGVFLLRTGQPGKMPAWMADPQYMPVGQLPYTGREHTLCALQLYAHQKYDEAYAAAITAEGRFHENQRWSLQLTLRILKATCLMHMGRPEQAMAFFHQAYLATWQNGMNTPFVEFGRDALALLDAAATQDALAFSTEWLNTVRRDTLEFIKREATMLHLHGSAATNRRASVIRLSPRESEAFGYLYQGLTREEIGAVMGISLNGVKKHITNIYTKLGAANRVDAIHIGMAAGLLEPLDSLY